MVQFTVASKPATGSKSARLSAKTVKVEELPEIAADINRLPPVVCAGDQKLRDAGLSLRLNGPSRVALFACDNNTFIVESYLPTETDVTVSVTGEFTKLCNLVTGTEITAQEESGEGWRQGGSNRIGFLSMCLCRRKVTAYSQWRSNDPQDITGSRFAGAGREC
jgi:hypothetical protein